MSQVCTYLLSEKRFLWNMNPILSSAKIFQEFSIGGDLFNGISRGILIITSLKTSKISCFGIFCLGWVNLRGKGAMGLIVMGSGPFSVSTAVFALVLSFSFSIFSFESEETCCLCFFGISQSSLPLRRVTA